MTDNTENLFEENGNIQDVFKDKTVEELEALFPSMDNEEPASPVVEPTTNPADDLIENRIVLQERITKLNELIAKKDTHGFSETVISTFNSALSELEGSLKEINSVLGSDPVADVETHNLSNKQTQLMEQFDKDIDDLYALDFKNMTTEELEEYFKTQKQLNEEEISNCDWVIHSHLKYDVIDVIEATQKRDHYMNKFDIISQRVNDELNVRKENDVNDLFNILTSNQAPQPTTKNEIDYTDLDRFTEQHRNPKDADKIIEERNKLEASVDNFSNLIDNKETLNFDDAFIKSIIENKNDATNKLKEANKSIRDMLNNKKLSEMTQIEFKEWGDIKKDAYLSANSRISDELMTTENHINSTRLHKERDENEKWYKEVSEKIKEEELKRERDYNSFMQSMHDEIDKENSQKVTLTEEDNLTREIYNNVGIEETMTLKKSSNLKNKLSQTRERIATNKKVDYEEEHQTPWYKKLGDVVDYFADGLKGSSNAKPVFLSEDKIYDTFGDEIDKIINRSKTRIIHFKDKTSVLESAQEIRAKGKNYNTVSEKMSKLAIAKGWKSITFEGSDVFLGVAYEKATRLGLVVEPQNAEQEELFKGIHKAKGLDEIMPFSGMKKEEVNNKEIDVPEVRATQGQRMRM
ncbi:TPA: LPD7 domain-containing protein [Salmonella enterica subsp. enterica]